MGNKNYSKFSKPSFTKNSMEQNDIIETIEEKNEEVLEQITIDDIANESIQEIVEETTSYADEQPIFASGHVIDCEKLNIRLQPSKEAEVVTILPKGTNVTVDILNSTEQYFKITTSTGLVGYAMRDYIEIPQTAAE